MSGGDAVCVQLLEPVVDVDANTNSTATSPATTPGSTNDDQRCLTNVAYKHHKDYSLKKKWNVAVWNLAPCFMALISIIQVMMFMLADERTSKLLRFEPVFRWQSWRLITYMLLHWGKIHLVLNVIIQCLIAIPLEVEQGGFRTVAVYFSGGMIGALGACILQPQPMVGASAGVYALLISHLAHLYLNFKSVKYRKYRVFSVCVLSISDVGFYAFHAKTAGHPTISLGAHGSGGLAGALLGLVIYKSSADDSEKYKKYVRIFAFTATVILLTLSLTAMALLPRTFFVR